MKITVIGDIMCEPPILKASKRKDGTYNFDGVFSKVKGMFAQSDYVIGNLETPLAGEEALYTQHFFSFNAPDAYVDAIKNAGIDVISTTNNHTFDRGYEGLKRTLKVLDEKGMNHTGTFYPGSSRQEAFYFEVEGVKFALIAYTYGTNYSKKNNPYLAEGEYADTVNLLRPQTVPVYLPGVLRKPDWVDKTFKFLEKEPRARIKKFLGMDNNYPRADDNLVPEAYAPYVEKFQQDIRTAKEKADVVIFYPHVGGQFNPKPGKISEYMIEKGVEAGADAVLASHSHIVQKAEMRGAVPCAYSLGNFSMSPESGIMLQEYLPGYGLAMHLYVEDKKITKVTFSILKAIEKKRTQLVSWPVDELYETLTSQREKEKLEKHVSQIYETVTGKKPEGQVIRREYELL